MLMRNEPVSQAASVTPGKRRVRLICTGPMHAPCLVLGNALGTDKRIWNGLERSLGGDYRLVRFDYPGHGGSPAWPAVSVAEMAKTLLAELDVQKIESFFYCGVSMGGALGLELAMQSSHRVRGLVLSNTAAHFGAPELWESRLSQAQLGGLAVLTNATVVRWLKPEHAQASPLLVSWLKEMFKATSLEGYVQCCRIVMSFDAREKLHLVQSPTLVIGGAQDRATSVDQALVLHKGISKSTYLELPAAHLAPLDEPMAFQQAMLEFLTYNTAQG